MSIISDSLGMDVLTDSAMNSVNSTKFSNCATFDASSPDNLSQYASSLESTSSQNEFYPDSNNSKEMPVIVYHKDRKHEVIVDENLTVGDFCHLMPLKLGFNRNLTWNLLIRLPNERVERVLEDWEEVLTTYRRFLAFKGILVIEQASSKKYEFFEKWSEYFPSDIVHTCNDGKSCSNEKDKKRSTGLSIPFGRKVNAPNKLNDIQSQLNYFDKLRIMVKNRLSVSVGKNGRQKDIDASFDTDRGLIFCIDKQSGHKTVLNVQNYHLLTSFWDNNEGNKSGEFYFCLIMEKVNSIDELPTVEPLECGNCELVSELNDGSNKSIQSDVNDIIWFYTDSLQKLNCWSTSFRLSKYGLHEYRQSYQEMKKKNESITYTATICPDTTQGKVLLHYSHEDGPLIIDDTSTLLALRDRNLVHHNINTTSNSHHSIYTSSYNNNTSDRSNKPIGGKSESSSQSSSPGSLTPKSPKSTSNCSPTKYAVTVEKRLHRDALKSLAYQQDENTLPWYYADLSREEASKLLSKYQNIDGVFLVRSSSKDPTSYVLSFVCDSKVIHCQVRQMEADSAIVLTLDHGQTKFYGLQQLVEFYQLNNTCLPTKLTCFLVYKPQSQPKFTSATD